MKVGTSTPEQVKKYRKSTREIPGAKQVKILYIYSIKASFWGF